MHLFVPDYIKHRGKWQFCCNLGKQRGYIKTFFLWSDFFIRSYIYTIFRTVQRLRKKQDQKDARKLKTKLNSKWIKRKVPWWWQKKLAQHPYSCCSTLLICKTWSHVTSAFSPFTMWMSLTMILTIMWIERDSFYKTRDQARGTASKPFVIKIKTSLPEIWVTENWRRESNATNVVIHVPMQVIWKLILGKIEKV